MEYGGSDQVVVDDLGDFATINVPEQEWLSITRIQNGWLAEIELPVSPDPVA